MVGGVRYYSVVGRLKVEIWLGVVVGKIHIVGLMLTSV